MGLLSTNILIELYLEIHARRFFESLNQDSPGFSKTIEGSIQTCSVCSSLLFFSRKSGVYALQNGGNRILLWYLGKLLSELVVAFGVDKADTDPSQNNCGQDTNEFTARSEGNPTG